MILFDYLRRSLRNTLQLLGCALLAAALPSAQAAPLQVLHNHVPAVIKALQPISRLDPAKRLNLAISLPLRNREALTNLLHDLYDPASPHYRHFLTPEQFAERFGPSQQDYDTLASFANANGLVIKARHPNRLVLDVEGAVGDIEKATHVRLNVYKHPTESRNFYAPDGEPSLDLTLPVLEVDGLENLYLRYPKMVKSPARNPQDKQPYFGSGPGGTYAGYDFRDAYAPGTPLIGTGQSVGLLEFDAFFPNDPVQYESFAGLPNVPLQVVSVDGGVPSPGFGNSEVSLDIEVAIAMAPGLSTIYVYEAPNGSPWVDILSRMANDNLAHQLSCSWGGGPPLTAGDQIFQQMAAQGQSFFNAVGDSDAFPVGQPIPFPSESPYSTQVGGTTLFTTGPLGAFTSEKVWNYGGGSGTCGGISVTYPIPVWQQGVDMSANGGSTTMRNMPDVAMTADNVFIIADNGTPEATGGTSCAAPLWAGFTALVNQQGAAFGESPLGFINPLIYPLGKSPVYTNYFHDVTVGDNTWSGSPNAYFAVPGYDLCTGWGSPNGTNLINALAPPSGISLIVSSNYVAGGNGNGIVDPDECNNLFLVLLNLGPATATGVRVTLSTSTPEAGIGQASEFYGDIRGHASATNRVPFSLDTSAAFVCGSPIVLNVVIKADNGAATNSIILNTGLAASTVLRFDNNTAAAIPSGDPNGLYSPLMVSGQASAINKVTVSLYAAESFDSDLIIQLISPGGLTNNLSIENGGGGVNYGAGCSPDAERTTFDDAAPEAISTGFAPFTGTFRPDQALAAFNGQAGTNINGTWYLHLVDPFFGDTGTLNCWSLFITPATCLDGGGECPSADMAIGISASPEPATVGNNLTYTITVTNNGPSSVKKATVGQTLPSGFNFVSASSSQGSASGSGGVVTASLGHMSVRGTATITVVVEPIETGTFSSTATVSSEVNDPVPGNNSATATSHVNPISADIAVGISALPSVQIDSNLTYTVSVTNNGPSAATGVTVTNVLAASVANISASVSQGSVSIAGNVVICSFNSLIPNAKATATIRCTPTAQGPITATATATANQPDPVPSNNSASVTTIVGPAADLTLSLVVLPNPVVPGSNFLCQVVIANQGPSSASHVALNGFLPAGLTLVSSSYNLDSLVISDGSVSGTVASLPSGASVHALITYSATIPVGTNSISFSVAANEPDPNLANNSASVVLTVAAPFVSIIPAGATLLYESGPTNGAIDIGETVTLNLFLENVGNVQNTGNLVATLLATNGVSPVGSPGFVPPPGSVPVVGPSQNYLTLAGGGVPASLASRQFTFTAYGTNGGVVTPTLALTNNGVFLANVSFSFPLPSLFTFANTNRIDIPTTAQDQNQPGPAAPYPSSISVSGVTGTVSKVTVTFSNLYHTYPHDINSLVIGPGGQQSLVMSHVASGTTMPAPQTVVFDDAAAAPLPASGDITAGVWQPSSYSPAPVFTNPAPAGAYPTGLSAFAGFDPTGVWNLWVNDDSQGDFGDIANGWSLAFTTVTPINQVADLALSLTTSPASVRAGDSITYTFTVTNAGPAAATGVIFTNLVPNGATLTSANSSQGSTSTNGNLAQANLGTLNPGAIATVTLVVTPLMAGSLTDTGSVFGTQLDLSPSDNTASALTSVGAAVADVALALSGPTNNVIVGSNFTYTITVTNSGPNSAVGVSVLLTNSPSGRMTNFACSLPLGTWTNQAGELTCSLGNLAPNATQTFYVTNTALSAGVVANTATASVSGSSDPNLANNTASVTNTLAAPAPIIQPAGQALVAESFSPPDDAVDPGETVTVSLTLTNAGQLPVTSLVATLQASGGVTLPSGSAAVGNYGTLSSGGPAKSANFTFTAANPVPGGAVVATLQLNNGSQYLGSISFTFFTPTTTSFVNTNAIIIPDHGPGIPYPAAINISGLTGVVTKATVTLLGYGHTFPSDVNVMLVSPAGGATLLVAAAGAGYSISNVNVTLDDAAAVSLPQNGMITNGTYKPTAYGRPAFPAPAPHPPFGGMLSGLNGTNPNGAWSLFVLDNVVGDAGVIAQGWTLTLTTVQPVNAVVDLAATVAGSANALYTLQNLDYSITVTNKASTTATGVTITDPLPASFGFSSASASQGAYSYSFSNNTVVFNIGSLSGGAGAAATINVTPSAGGVFVNTVTAAANQAELNYGDNTAQTTTTVLTPAPAIMAIRRHTPQFDVTISAEPGLKYSLQTTTNLLQANSWTTLFTQVATNGVIRFTTTNATTSLHQYYRAVRITP